MQPRPHDLLFLHAPDAFVADDGWPDWLDAAGLAQAPVVVRRALTAPGVVPVGARGLARHERCRGFVAAGAVARAVTPEQLARRAPAPGDGDLPCIAALHAVAPRLDALGVHWGPAGGVGFWLASGLPVLRATSDLDLLVRLPGRPSAALVAALCALQDGQPCRIDIQLDTGSGGCALAEYARGGRVLLKTAAGPRLLDDPWQRAA